MQNGFLTTESRVVNYPKHGNRLSSRKTMLFWLLEAGVVDYPKHGNRLPSSKNGFFLSFNAWARM